MDMQSGDPTHAVMNNHSWYRIETPTDYLRAAVSVITVMVIRLSRNPIVDMLESISRAIRDKPP